MFPGARKEMRDWRLGFVECDSNLGSPTNLNLAREWLTECQKHHTRCSKGQICTPTRLIDVRVEGIYELPRLVNLDGVPAQYAALSHCWGGNIKFKTLHSNIENMQKGMVWADMPLNFQDFIHITRGLGLNYLWIDSLCIIQDSISDWEYEAARMGDVYSNATITIAAAVAKNSAAGILTKTELPSLLFEIKFDEMSSPDDTLCIYPKS